MVALTAGGELARRAEELGIGRVIVPGGYMPRAAFGLLSTGAIGALEAMGIMPPHADEGADELAAIPGIGSVDATRWKSQLNENAKVPSFASALPELDHNEVEGWSSGSGAGFALIALRHPGEDGDVAARFPLS